MLTKHRSQLLSRFVCQTMWMGTCKLCTPVISTTQWPTLDYNTHQDTWIFTCVQIFIWMPPVFLWYLNWHKYFTTRWPIGLLSGFLLWCHQFFCGTFRDLYFAIKQWVVSLLVIVDLKCSLVSWWSTCYRMLLKFIEIFGHKISFISKENPEM